MLAAPTYSHLHHTRRRRIWRGWFVRGFVAMLPLWAGAIPSGIAYGVAAQAVGLGIGETQLMSVLIFSSSAQISVVALLGGRFFLAEQLIEELRLACVGIVGLGFGRLLLFLGLAQFRKASPLLVGIGRPVDARYGGAARGRKASGIGRNEERGALGHAHVFLLLADIGEAGILEHLALKFDAAAAAQHEREDAGHERWKALADVP